MIFFGTRELYKLSNYKGLKYFRYSFLFFAIAFFFRYAIKAIIFLFNVNNIIEFNPSFLGPLTLFIFIYANSIAIFYLLYSLIWKNYKTEELLFVFHLISLSIAATIIAFPTNTLYLIINIILLAISITITIIAYRNKKNNKSNLYIIYFLLFLISAINLIDILVPRFFQLYQSLIYIATISIFMIILYKVLKRSG
jgi:hypothetical protein